MSPGPRTSKGVCSYYLLTDGPITGRREFSPAVIQAFLSFWNDEEGPGGVAIQARYHAMLSHVAARFSRYDAVTGYDPMNEPNAFSEEILTVAAPGLGLEDQTAALSSFYQRALAAIREGQQSADSPARLMLCEPSNDWAFVPALAVRPVFDHDGQVVYSPHIYQGGITGGDLEEADFQLARDDAAMYGGVPVLTGEWGTSAARAIDPADDYFERSFRSSRSDLRHTPESYKSRIFGSRHQSSTQVTGTGTASVHCSKSSSEIVMVIV